MTRLVRYLLYLYCVSIYYIYCVCECVTILGTISIHEERLQISEAGGKQKESI